MPVEPRDSAASTWPSDERPSLDEPVLRDGDDLIAALGVKDLHVMQEWIEDETGFQADITASSADGLSVILNGQATFDIDFPTTLREALRRLHNAEGYARCLIECQGFATEVTDLEGFKVVAMPDGHGPQHDDWPRTGLPELPDYPFVRRSPGSWTLARWRRTRVDRVLRGVEMNVEVSVADARGFDVVERTTIKSLRQMYADGKLWADNCLW